MAKAWQYPRWRYYLMQAVMWGLLGGMVALAGLVDHHRRHALEVRLSAPQTRRNLTIQLPEGWKSERKPDPDSPTLFELQDPLLRRTLIVKREPGSTFISPAQYVMRMFGKGPQLSLEPITIAGTPGTLARGVISVNEEGDEDSSSDAVEVQIIAAATVLPSGHAIAVQLIGPVSPGTRDIDLVKKIAGSIEAHGEPKTSDDDIRLRDGTTIDVPDGWSGIVSQDPNRSSREMRQQPGPSTAWRGVTFVPVALLPGDSAAQIETLCTAWDDSWRTAHIKHLSQSQWRVERATEPWSEYAANQIYVIEDENGHSVMAVFCASGSDDSWIEPLWKAISDGVKFAPTSDLGQRLQAGAQAVAQVREHGADQFIGEARQQRQEQWWLLCRETPAHPLGWVHEEPSPSAWREKDETRMYYPDRIVATWIEQWEGTPNLSAYESAVVRRFMSTEDEELDSLRISARLNQGKLELSASGSDIDSTKAIVNVPANYLPGGWVGTLLGKLPDQKMILETDSFNGSEGAPTLSLVRLIVTPSSDVAHSGEADAKPLRCVNVEVNGSGEITRWFLEPDGRIDSIDYSDGVRQVKSDLATIRAAFTVAAMKP